MPSAAKSIAIVARQLHERRLADRIEPAPGLRDLRGDRREVDDRTAPLRSHVRAHRLRHHHRAHDVDVQGLEPIVARRRSTFVDVRAGEVDEEVDTAEALDGLRDELLDLRIVADVGRREEDALAELVGERLSTLGVDVRDGDVRTLLVEGANDRLPDQRRAAGHDRRSVRQPTHRSHSGA